jgi:DNA uptake protein and related DNA-binding proteins
VAIDERVATGGDPRRRLTAVLGSAPVEPYGERARDPAGAPDEVPVRAEWIEEAVVGPPPVPDRPDPPPAGIRGLLPAAVRGARIDPGRRGAVALVVAAVVAALVAVVVVWGGQPRAEPVAALPVVSVAEQGPTPPAPSAEPTPVAGGPSEPVVVSVVGKVQRPGLVSVPEGARVADVLAAAGGAQPGVDVTQLNLARRVADGEQIAVGVPAAPDAAPTAAAAGDPATGSGGAAGGPIDLNTADVGRLDSLPGVGPVTAQRIVEWRTRHGRFTRVEQLREIEGIGDRRFEQLRGLVRV